MTPDLGFTHIALTVGDLAASIAFTVEAATSRG
jgi:hypothetical protein